MVIGETQNFPKFAKSFTAQIIIFNYPSEIKIGYSPIVHCHTAHVPCKIVEFLEKIDRCTRPAKRIDKTFKQGDAGIVKMEPMKNFCVEPFHEFPPLGRFAILDIFTIKPFTFKTKY